jgi:hemolysin activation/secretion protein
MKNPIPNIAILAMLAPFAAPSLAFAQAGPSILDQGRADRSPPTVSPAPVAPKARPHGAAEGPQTEVSPFVLREVRIAGSSVPDASLRAAWAPFVGRTVGQDELKALATAVSDAYGRSDIALYTVITPRQTFENGVVLLAVIEGRLADVRISGPGDGRLIRAYARKLQREPGPLTRSRLERYLSLMRDIPGVSLDADLLRGSHPGEVVLQVRTRRKRIEAGLSLNNRGTAYLGTNQIRADVWLDGLFLQGDQTRLTFAAPTDFDRFQYYGAQETIPLGSEGTTASFTAGYIRTHPAYTTITGSADAFSLQLSHPLLRSYQRNLYVTGDLDSVDSTNAAYGQALFTEKVRTVRGAAAYSLQTPLKAMTLSGTLSAGLNGLGAQTLIPGWSKPDFVKLNLGAKWSHTLGKRWALRLDAAGQYTGDKLPGSEQFSLGGDEFGRAFPSTITTGDTGAAGSAELAYRPQRTPAALAGSEAYVFADAGQVHWRARPLYAAYTESLSSAGVGARFAVKSKAVLELEAANALVSPLPGESGGWRVTLSVRSLMN